MREEKLFRAIGDVGDDLIARADEPVQKKKPVRWAGIAALAACCLIAVGLARLVTMSMGNTSDSTAALDAAAPETAMMQATEDAKSGSAENGALKLEGADDMMDAAANDAEAPAETEDAETTTDTPADSVETWTIGPLTLGMTGDEIQESLGAPDAESNSGPVEETDGSLRVCWFYQIDNAPGQLYSVKSHTSIIIYGIIPEKKPSVKRQNGTQRVPFEFVRTVRPRVSRPALRRSFSGKCPKTNIRN